ncbi:hypothetical protein [Brevundimonas aveniformis]|uniref:hypothetical protein n=1 Tax=Brevundimonas aveniformis TaxID=370977 RepID=UPI00248F9D68|nr:hypothetical protein [Brevundimonas aveniformis]
MAERGVDLSGRWSGVYFFPADDDVNPDDSLPPTPFTAELEDHEGCVTGNTVEPDLFADHDNPPPIPAAIEGHHAAGVLTFTKSPNGGGQIHTIDYVGTISADGNAISGTWIIFGDWSGTFRMQRSEVDATVAVEREAAI